MQGFVIPVSRGSAALSALCRKSKFTKLSSPQALSFLLAVLLQHQHQRWALLVCKVKRGPDSPHLHSKILNQFPNTANLGPDSGALLPF